MDFNTLSAGQLSIAIKKKSFINKCTFQTLVIHVKIKSPSSNMYKISPNTKRNKTYIHKHQTSVRRGVPSTLPMLKKRRKKYKKNTRLGHTDIFDPSV